MKISRFSCENYARLENFEIEIHDNLFIVGANDTGKSSLLRLMNWLLGYSHAGLYASIGMSDFRDREFPLVATATLVDFSDSEKAAFPDEITVDKESGEYSLSISLVANYDQIEDRVSIRRFFPDAGHERNLTRQQLEAIGWSFTGVFSRNRDIRGDKQDGLASLLSELELRENEADFDALGEDFATLLAEIEPLIDLRNEISRSLNQALPYPIDEKDLEFVPGSLAWNNPLEGVRLMLKKQNESKDIADQSDGIRALYSMALTNLKESNKNIFAIDEPESHLHPSAQRSLTRMLLRGPSQKIVVTHSPDIISKVSPEDLIVIRPGGVIVQPSKGFLSGQENLIARWWSRNKLEPLTARKLLVVEGVSDSILINKAAEVLDLNLDALGCVVVELDGAGDVKPLLKLFGKDGFDVELHLLIDEDAEKTTAGHLGVKVGELNQNNVFVSKRDLEDEYVKAIGAGTLWPVLEESGLFTNNELKNCDVNPTTNLPSDDQLAAFLRGKSKRKTNGAIVVAEILTASTAQSIKSIRDLLDGLQR